MLWTLGGSVTGGGSGVPSVSNFGTMRGSLCVATVALLTSEGVRESGISSGWLTSHSALNVIV